MFSGTISQNLIPSHKIRNVRHLKKCKKVKKKMLKRFFQDLNLQPQNMQSGTLATRPSRINWEKLEKGGVICSRWLWRKKSELFAPDTTKITKPRTPDTKIGTFCTWHNKNHETSPYLTQKTELFAPDTTKITKPHHTWHKNRNFLHLTQLITKPPAHDTTVVQLCDFPCVTCFCPSLYTVQICCKFAAHPPLEMQKWSTKSSTTSVSGSK